MVYKRVKGWTSGWSLPYKTLLSTPPSPLGEDKRKVIDQVENSLACTTQRMIGIMMLLQVYKGYVDDPRNTDNAWMETVAVNFHDDTGEVFSEFKLQVSNLFRLFSCEVSRSVSVGIHVWLYSL